MSADFLCPTDSPHGWRPVLLCTASVPGCVQAAVALGTVVLAVLTFRPFVFFRSAMLGLHATRRIDVWTSFFYCFPISFLFFAPICQCAHGPRIYRSEQKPRGFWLVDFWTLNPFAVSTFRCALFALSFFSLSLL